MKKPNYYCIFWNVLREAMKRHFQVLCQKKVFHRYIVVIYNDNYVSHECQRKNFWPDMITWVWSMYILFREEMK